jgi:hypothetical protein
MRSSCWLWLSVIGVLLVASVGCGPNEQAEKAKKMNKQLNALADKRAAGDTLLELAIQDAEKAIAEKDKAGLSKAVTALQEQGENAVSSLTETAKDSSAPSERRLTALILLGEIGERAQSAVGALVELREKDANSEIKKAAAEAIAKIQKKP